MILIDDGWHVLSWKSSINLPPSLGPLVEDTSFERLEVIYQKATRAAVDQAYLAVIVKSREHAFCQNLVSKGRGEFTMSRPPCTTSAFSGRGGQLCWLWSLLVAAQMF